MYRDPFAVLRSWEQSGGAWYVVGRTAHDVTVSLRTCSGGEEVDRLVSADPALMAYLARRSSSEDELPES